MVRGREHGVAPGCFALPGEVVQLVGDVDPVFHVAKPGRDLHPVAVVERIHVATLALDHEEEVTGAEKIAGVQANSVNLRQAAFG